MLVCICVAFQKWQNQQQGDTMISKNSSNVAGASKITYALLWQFSNTNLRGTYYCTLLLFRIVLTQQGLYHSYTKTMKHFTDQIQDAQMSALILKKIALGMVLQKLILVNLRCLYKNNLKRNVFTMPQCILPEIVNKVFFCITDHLPLVVEQCFFIGCYFKLSCFLPCDLNYDNAEIDE